MKKINLNYNVHLLGEETNINASKILALEMMKLTGIDGNLSRLIAELAKKIHIGEDFDLSEDEISSLENVVSNMAALPVFVKDSILKYLDSIE